jgi:hypothetical protein
LKNIPTEVDELMWGIAESGDINAVEQFHSRHPQFSDELLRRVRSMDALRKAGQEPKREVPVFRPKQTAPVNTRPLFWVAGLAGAIVLASLGYAFVQNKNELPPVVKNTIVEGTVSQNFNPAPPITTPAPNPQPVEPNIPERSQDTNIPNPSQVVEPNEGKTTVKLESSTLHAAIQLIAASGGYAVTIAPGLPNPDVRINYEELTPIDMLRELGKDYAFSVLPDGEKELLVLPMKDDTVTDKDDGNQTD